MIHESWIVTLIPYVPTPTVASKLVLLDYTCRTRVAPLGTLVWKTFDVNLTWIMIFSSAKSCAFLFLHTWTQLWKFMVFGSYTLRKTFFICSSKKLDVVTITRYQITFWIFDFSLLEILPEYEPKNRVTHAVPCMICQKIRTPDVRTYGRVRTSIFKRLPHKSP